MSETANQAQFNGWAKVEVMGHQSHIGLVTTEAYGQAVLFRIDSPEVPEAEETLEVADWVGEQRCPAGTVVKRPKIEAHTVLVGSGSIYRIIPCSEAAAMRAIREGQRRPLMLVRVPEGKALAAAVDTPPAPEEICPACGRLNAECNCLLADDDVDDFQAVE